MIFLNIGNITERFELLSGIDKAEVPKWQCLIADACNCVYSKVKKENLTDDDISRLDFLCAVYACRLYLAAIPSEPTSFTAGDFKVISSADKAEKIEKLWKEASEKYSDLLESKNFLFGAVCG